MRTFELNIFIDRPRIEVYNQISEPINMIGLQPYMTSIDVLKEQRAGNGIVLRPFYTMHTYKWIGIPVRRERIYSVIHLTQPHSELEIHVFQKRNTQLVFLTPFNSGKNVQESDHICKVGLVIADKQDVSSRKITDVFRT